MSDPYVGKRTILKVITPKGTYDLDEGYMQSLLELIEVRRVVLILIFVLKNAS